MVGESKKDIKVKLTKINRDAEERDAMRRAKASGFKYIDLRDAPVSIKALQIVPKDKAIEAKLVPLQRGAKNIAIATYDPNLESTKKILEEIKQKKLEPKLFLSSMSGIEQAWTNYSFIPKKSELITKIVAIGKQRLSKLTEQLKGLDTVKSMFTDADFKITSVTELVEIIFVGAIANRASDIHLEAGEENSRLRYRIDGTLHDISNNLPKRNYIALINRLKLLSGLKLNVFGEAQDGRLTISLFGKNIEVRVSIIPSEYGETVVMRILDPSAISLGLKELGLRSDDMKIVENEVVKPNGFILNTGPTGSGKTTTLYAFLRHINNPEIKVITIEDPIEYHLSGIEQTQTNNEYGYTFADGLRAIVRQDPDAILVGEIRDKETAEIALQAALTGHLVFSTLHTNSAIGAVPRLIALGAKPENIGPAISLVIAQRLVRVLCEHCKKPIDITSEMKEKIKTFLEKLPKRVVRESYSSPKIYEPGGCSECGKIGYHRRVGIYEFLRGGPALEELILKSASEPAIEKLANEQGMVSMQVDGVLKVLVGKTSFDEVEKVTGPIEW